MIERDDILAREIIQENTVGKVLELALADNFLGELELRLEQIKMKERFGAND
jgi:hypothetical protein